MKSSDLLDNYHTSQVELKDFQFPLDFQFKIATIHNDFIVKDRAGNTISYVRQKMLRLKEKVEVYTSDSMKDLQYTIQADRWIDFNAHYNFVDKNGAKVGSMGRKGMKSLWRSNYQIFNTEKQEVFTIREENPWAKVGDSFVGELPIISFFTGYLFHPKYGVLDREGKTIARLSKVQSFFGRKFKLEQLEEISPMDKQTIMLSLMMMILMERQRG